MIAERIARVGVDTVKVKITREDVEERDELKSAGFRWTGECWQMRFGRMHQLAAVMTAMTARGHRFVVGGGRDTGYDLSQWRRAGLDLAGAPLVRSDLRALQGPVWLPGLKPGEDADALADAYEQAEGEPSTRAA